MNEMSIEEDWTVSVRKQVPLYLWCDSRSNSSGKVSSVKSKEKRIHRVVWDRRDLKEGSNPPVMGRDTSH